MKNLNRRIFQILPLRTTTFLDRWLMVYQGITQHLMKIAKIGSILGLPPRTKCFLDGVFDSYLKKVVASREQYSQYCNLYFPFQINRYYSVKKRYELIPTPNIYMSFVKSISGNVQRKTCT